MIVIGVTVFWQVLEIEPNNGFAKVHLGFIVQTSDNDPASAIDLMRDGIASNEPGVIDGRFFFHLGDALQRLGRKEEAYEVYEDGASKGTSLRTNSVQLSSIIFS